jgi:hypothetical protein
MDQNKKLYLPEYGLRDRQDNAVGLTWQKSEKNITVKENLVFADTRDCIGEVSLRDAQTVFIGRGGKSEVTGFISTTTGAGISPIVITSGTVLTTIDLNNDNKVSISGVEGNTAANGTWFINNINLGLNTFELIGSLGNSNYTGGGIFIRPADPGYPTIKDTNSTIIGNIMTIKLNKKLKVIRDISLIHTVIPRDIIPLTAYLPDFIEFSIFSQSDVGTCLTNSIEVASYIPQEAKYLEERLLGYYSSPLDAYRTYRYGSFPLPNQYTPPPLVLWNPLVGAWPDQLKPYPFQTVPTYRSQDFTIPNKPGTFYNICSGYGVYDLSDWTSTSGLLTPGENYIRTILARHLLIILLTPIHSYRDEDYISLILNSLPVDSFGSGSPFLGFGDYQRFLPGPGLGMAYQPGTVNDTMPDADPTIVTPQSPVPFPNFRGNVWGPYDTPGDRFQKLGVRDLIQDHYLNHDTNNLSGTPIIKTWVATECFMEDTTFGLNFPPLVEVNLSNIQQTTNPNFLNSMRLVPNGFGALAQQAQGDTIPSYQTRFQSSGGQGPHPDGVPATPATATSGTAWVNDTVLTSATGTSSFINPIAAGPQSGLAVTGAGTEATVVPQVVDAEFPGNAPGGGGDDEKDITHRISWYDIGPNSKQLLTQIDDYNNWVIADLPDTNIVLHVNEALRNIRVQSTNTIVGDCLLSCPIRLNLGTSSGTIQYVENVQAFLASSTEYWQKRFISPLATLYKLDISFTTYENIPIPLEKMLQTRRSVQLLSNFERIFANDSAILFDIINPRNVALAFLFNPLDPTLNGRQKRNFSMIFKINTYEYESPGLYLGVVRDMLEFNSELEQRDEPFVVRASNYQDYTSTN